MSRPSATPSAPASPSLSTHLHPAVGASLLGGRPELCIKSAAADRLRRGATQLRRDDILTGAADAVPGQVVWLRDDRGRPHGSALLAAPGPTPLFARLFDRDGADLDRAQLLHRLQAADALRRSLLWNVPAVASTGPDGDPGERRDAYRMVHGEADGLPGLFIDRYGDAAVLQTATAAMDARKDLIAELLVGPLGCRLVVCRDDGSARDLEALPRNRGVLRDLRAPQSRGEHPTQVTFHDAGSRMQADLLTDRKTGSFLDQQENHAVAAAYARALTRTTRTGTATALDAFTYHGGFALALARAGLRVTACDEDRDAIARARHNATLCGVDVDFRVANSFDLLRRLEADRAGFDVVVVDPPALAKRGRDRGHDDGAAWMRAYKELNLRAIRLLSPGGLLVTCSCSGRVSASQFGELISAAAEGGGRRLQLLERRGAGRDHPVLIGWSDSEYLKCWVLRALD